MDSNTDSETGMALNNKKKTLVYGKFEKMATFDRVAVEQKTLEICLLF